MLLAVSFPPLHLLIPPFVALVPFAVFMAGLPPGGEGRAAAVRGGLVLGTLYFGALVYWILVALIWFSKLAILAYVGSMLLLMGLSALFAWTFHRMYHGMSVPLWLALPVAWTAAEWFRAHWPGPLAFPWLGLGSSLTGFPELVGMAEVVGARGVTFWLALVNGILAGIVLRHRAGDRPVRSWGAVLLVAALPMAWGVWRAGNLVMREAARVAVVQPNIPEHIKLDARTALDSTFASLDRLIPQVEPGSVDLIVLPEVALPLYPRAEYAQGWMDRVAGYAATQGAPVLLGGLGFSGDLFGAYVPYNSAFLVTQEGLTGYQYDKRYLVPMVERVPLLPASWLRNLRYFGKFGVGQGWPLAEVNGEGYGVLVCYESTYPEGARHFRGAGADILLNITNDAWYGREPWYARTTALWQHPAHMVMRAIENRMGVARSANTGISLFVDPVGRVYGEIELFTAGVRAEAVLTTDVTTLYTRLGDLTGNGSAMVAVLMVLASLRAGRDRDPEGPLGR
ncbi:MAG: apolipoprotein N-acyltransferase [Gemmatimonadota bacterium]|nr:apolipoprotein N-acyltransferase [Gemmatimonadota bacterium]MDH5759377.1 apolipoprotein N-acyltransferase [Gemmatimonadota bacterium]